MIARLFLLLFFCSSFIKPGTIQWNVNRRLSWSDFKASPPANAANAALTSSGILMSFSTNGENFHYELSCNFDEKSSWGRVQNDYILAHEQGHFDIAELYTRKLNALSFQAGFTKQRCEQDLSRYHAGTSANTGKL